MRLLPRANCDDTGMDGSMFSAGILRGADPGRVSQCLGEFWAVATNVISRGSLAHPGYT